MTFYVKKESLDYKAGYRLMAFLLFLQAVLLIVSSITGVFAEFAPAAGIAGILVAVVAGLIFHSKEDSSRMRWTFAWFLVFNLCQCIWMEVIKADGLVHATMLKWTVFFSLQSAICLTVGLWLLRQYLRRYAPPAEEGEKKQ